MARWFRAVWEAVSEHGLAGLLGLIPGGTIAYAVASKLWQMRAEQKREAELLKRARAEAEEVVWEATGEAPRRIRSKASRTCDRGRRSAPYSIPSRGWYPLTALVLLMIGSGIYAGIAVFAKPAARVPAGKQQADRTVQVPDRRVAPGVSPARGTVARVGRSEPPSGAGAAERSRPPARPTERAKDGPFGK
jgi:hypothetical protein